MGDLTTLANVKQWLGISGLAIGSLTNTNPTVVTLAAAPAFPLLTGSVYGFQGINGFAGLNGLELPITWVSASSFSVPFNGTLAGVYTGGGLAGVSDQLLSRLISAISAFIQNYITRTIALTTYNETRNGLGGYVMTLKNAPVASVASLTINGVAISPRAPLGPYPQTSNGYGGYTFDDTRIYVNGTDFCRGVQNINVIYAAGYASTPPDIEQAAIDMVGDWFRYMSRIGKLSEGIEGQTITFTNSAMTSRAKAVLDVYNQRAPVY